MIVCPLCEHSQAQGDTCEQCGLLLGGPPKPAPVAAVRPGAPPEAPGPEPSVAVADLELSRYPSATVAPSPKLAELEPTAFRAAPVEPAETAMDVERTAQESVSLTSATLIPELETGRNADDGVRTAPADAAGNVTCRYCRHVQQGGLLCDGCGRAFPRGKPVPLVAGAPKAGEGEWTRCKCGGKARAGRPCPSCGLPVAIVS